MPKFPEARKVLREQDKELAAASVELGQTLVWNTEERAVLAMIGAEIDRKVDLTNDYESAQSPSARVAISAELRLLEASVQRLLKQINTDVPAAPAASAPLSAASATASRAGAKGARSRWHGAQVS